MASLEWFRMIGEVRRSRATNVGTTRPALTISDIGTFAIGSFSIYVESLESAK